MTFRKILVNLEAFLSDLIEEQQTISNQVRNKERPSVEAARSFASKMKEDLGQS